MNSVNGALQSELAPPRYNRRGWPFWTRYPAVLLTYGLIWPVTRTLELFGQWPRSLMPLLARRWGTFGDYQPTRHDVLICSYFKSGTNWMMQIVVQTAHRGRASFEHIHDLVAWPDVSPKENYAVKLEDDSPWRDAPTQLRAIKTHLPMSYVPHSAAARYICVVRDPKDVCVSGFHFIRKTMLGPLMPAMSSWLNNCLSPHSILGSWAEHLQSFWEIRHKENVLFLTYEEMLADLPAIVRRVAGFMGVNLTANEFAAVLEQSSFSHMKAIDDRFEPTGMCPPWADPQGAMMRRGQRGAANELLSAAQQQRIDDYWRSELVRLECDFPYDLVFGSGRNKE